MVTTEGATEHEGSYTRLAVPNKSCKPLVAAESQSWGEGCHKALERQRLQTEDLGFNGSICEKRVKSKHGQIELQTAGYFESEERKKNESVNAAGGDQLKARLR